MVEVTLSLCGRSFALSLSGAVSLSLFLKWWSLSLSLSGVRLWWRDILSLSFPLGVVVSLFLEGFSPFLSWGLLSLSLSLSLF